MKVYVLVEQVYPACETAYNEVIGVYENLEKAEKEKAKVIKDNLEHYNFIEDVENVKHPFAISRIFLDFQENWNNYIEYRIIESEVE